MPINVVVILVGLVAGIAIGLHGPLSSIINQRLGLIESLFIVHLGGLIAALIPFLIIGGGRIADWRSVPWYTLGIGSFGLVVVGAVTYMIPRVGASATVVILVAGQLLVGVLLDHFGLLEVTVRPMDIKRVIGLSVVFVGVWLTVR